MFADIQHNILVFQYNCFVHANGLCNYSQLVHINSLTSITEYDMYVSVWRNNFSVDTDRWQNLDQQLDNNTDMTQIASATLVI
jgi:hypothetical protein